MEAHGFVQAEKNNYEEFNFRELDPVVQLAENQKVGSKYHKTPFFEGGTHNLKDHFSPLSEGSF